MGEWQFICGQDRRWAWEVRENGSLVQCSLGHFKTKTRCMKDARVHGYSPMFCRHREITLDEQRAAQQSMSDRNAVTRAAKDAKPPKMAPPQRWLIAAVMLALGIGLSVAVWLPRSNEGHAMSGLVSELLKLRTEYSLNSVGMEDQY